MVLLPTILWVALQGVLQEMLSLYTICHHKVNCCNYTTTDMSPQPTFRTRGKLHTIWEAVQNHSWCPIFFGHLGATLFALFLGMFFNLRRPEDIQLCWENKVARPGYCMGGNKPAEIHSKLRKFLVSVAVILTILLPNSGLNFGIFRPLKPILWGLLSPAELLGAMLAT